MVPPIPPPPRRIPPGMRAVRVDPPPPPLDTDNTRDGRRPPPKQCIGCPSVDLCRTMRRCLAIRPQRNQITASETFLRVFGWLALGFALGVVAAMRSGT